MRNTFGFSRSLLTAGLFGLLLTASLSGCTGSSTNAPAEKKEATLEMKVLQVDQLSKLGDKVPDGQYLVAKVAMKNMSNESIQANPTDFALENITENEAERYSQPAEKMMTVAFSREYGEALKDKLIDFTPTNLYPRLQVERYFVFMVPADAQPDKYQITYRPAKVSAPLVSTDTPLNDRRNASSQ
jgi:hypothetical protein